MVGGVCRGDPKTAQPAASSTGKPGSLLAHLKGTDPIVLEPSQVRDVMRALWEIEGPLMSLLFHSSLPSGSVAVVRASQLL
jgi:hypothetical protein